MDGDLRRLQRQWVQGTMKQAAEYDDALPVPARLTIFAAGWRMCYLHANSSEKMPTL
jgi:hypothetical protein